jgi:putative DNA primase/helicase
LNGIDEFVRRDDLADRCLFLHLGPIAAGSRRAESEFWSAFKADYPAILGGLLNAVAGGLGCLPSVQLAELPRMADFACLGEAVARGLGWGEGAFLSAYNENRQAATLASLEDSVVAKLLMKLAKSGRLTSFTRCATDMLQAFSEYVEPRSRASVRWPRTPRAFADELRRIAPLVRTRGISVEFVRTSDQRLITIKADEDSDPSTRL